MSWIFGYFGKRGNKEIKLPEQHIQNYHDSNLNIYISGNPDTIFPSDQPENTFSWAVAGVGVKRNSDHYELMSSKDWGKVFCDENINLNEFDGHFVALRLRNGILEFYTDQLGLRDIYLVEMGDGIGFTTRLDWMKYFISPEIDIEQFGSRWLLFNQISRKCIIKNVIRLVSGSALIKEHKILLENYHWTPDFGFDKSEERFTSVLNRILSIKDKHISLSLSGGIDSRFLLSFLLSNKNYDWDAHTFGNPNHPDSIIASRLSNELKFRHEIIDADIPSVEKTVRLIKEYSAFSIVTNPVSSILNLRFYDRFSNSNTIVIDGGFGEIWRMEFAKRLYLNGSNAIRNKNTSKIFELLKHQKADVFNDEAAAKMKEGTIVQLEELFAKLPEPDEIGYENWIDLFSIRTRLPNYYAPEQARGDHYALALMPLAMRDLLELLFSISPSQRKNSRFIKELIRENSFKLTQFPLVKGNVIHPFFFGSVPARIYSKIISRLGYDYKGSKREMLFTLIKDFVFDLLDSNEVRNCNLYDYKKLVTLVEKSYGDKNNTFYELDWWLTFELFRQAFERE